ncbi:MAG: hypothetical protein IPO21_15650 [Bacteroidales bacterium]|nr:hypothetical protein [Bacteroidales bacterium]
MVTEKVHLGTRGVNFGAAGVDLAILGVDLATPDVHLEALGVHLGVLGVHLGTPDVHLEATGVHLGARGVRLGARGVHLEATGVDLEATGVDLVIPVFNWDLHNQIWHIFPCRDARPCVSTGESSLYMEIVLKDKIKQHCYSYFKQGIISIFKYHKINFVSMIVLTYVYKIISLQKIIF